MHIPHPNTGESLKDKYNEVGFILDGHVDMVKCRYEYQYLYFLKKPN